MKQIWETRRISHRFPEVNDCTQYIRAIEMASEECVTILDVSY